MLRTGETVVMAYGEALLFGVMGDPVRQSKSPIMHNCALQELGIHGTYAALHVKPDALSDAIRGIRALGYLGVNVTIPHKVTVMEYLDEIDDAARLIGAVNTIVNDSGRLIGYNTDGIGYVRSLKEEVERNLRGKRILILGAGGAARGIVHALMQEEPERIWIANRTVERAQELAVDFRTLGPIVGLGTEQIADIYEEVDVIINTTSVGMFPHTEDVPVNTDWLRPEMIVSDLIYNPLETKFLRLAKQRGCRIHGGLGMFVYQGAYAFEYWTGKTAPVEAMRQAVLQSLYG